MYCKIIRSKQAGKMSDVLFFISWASLVPVAVQAAALSVERVEVEINPICVFFPHGFTQLKDVMDDCICCRKESELYTLLWVFGFPLFLYPSLRDEVVCADKRPFCSCPWDKTNGWTEKTKALSGVILVAISCFWHGCCCTAPQTAGNVVVLTKVLSRMRNMRIITIFPHRWAYGKASWNKTSLDKKGWKQRRNTCHLQMQEIRFMNMWQHQS